MATLCSCYFVCQSCIPCCKTSLVNRTVLWCACQKVALLLAHSDCFAHCIMWLVLHCAWTICWECYIAFVCCWNYGKKDHLAVHLGLSYSETTFWNFIGDSAPLLCLRILKIVKHRCSIATLDQLDPCFGWIFLALFSCFLWSENFKLAYWAENHTKPTS